MNGMYFLMLLLFCSLIRTEPLTCLSNCSVTYVNHDGSTDLNSCINITSEICKVQIIAYYNETTFPKYFNYTFGFIGDSQEEEHKQFVKEYGLINFIEYQFIINAKKEETILIADIYCGKTDDCIFNEIKQLFRKYSHQINPFYKLKSLIYSDVSPSKLLCYVFGNRSTEQCLTSNNPVCISNSTDSRQECSSELDVRIHYTFTTSSTDITASQRTTELVICNKDNCNDEKILIKLETIARYHSYDIITMTNTANGWYLINNHMFFGLLLINIYYIV